MDGTEFVKKVKQLAKKRGCRCEFEPRHGKGSHGQLLLGDRLTTVKKGEISEGLLHAMLKQLGLSKSDIS
nr:type II toxin-antitoxin system HicA family toxin [uncultured Rhodopila sp.]